MSNGELRVSENTKLVGLPDGWANAEEIQRVVLWDIGPEKPELPVKPKHPGAQFKEGTADYDLAMIDFRQECDEYETALKRYRALKAEFDTFQTRFGGPYEILFWSCDARDALEHDRKAVEEGRQGRLRYYISSRTRGHERAANRGLPRGMRPGHGQDELEERRRQGEVDLIEARKADPVFGPHEERAQ